VLPLTNHILDIFSLINCIHLTASRRSDIDTALILILTLEYSIRIENPVLYSNSGDVSGCKILSIYIGLDSSV